MRCDSHYLLACCSTCNARMLFNTIRLYYDYFNAKRCCESFVWCYLLSQSGARGVNSLSNDDNSTAIERSQRMQQLQQRETTPILHSDSPAIFKAKKRAAATLTRRQRQRMQNTSYSLISVVTTLVRSNLLQGLLMASSTQLLIIMSQRQFISPHFAPKKHAKAFERNVFQNAATWQAESLCCRKLTTAYTKEARKALSTNFCRISQALWF